MNGMVKLQLLLAARQLGRPIYYPVRTSCFLQKMANQSIGVPVCVYTYQKNVLKFIS